MSALESLMETEPSKGDKVTRVLGLMGPEYASDFNTACSQGYPSSKLAEVLRKDTGWNIDRNAVSYYRTKLGGDIG